MRVMSRQHERKSEGMITYDPDRVEQALFLQSLFNAALLAAISGVIAATNSTPGRPNTRTATREQEVVVEFILLHGRASPSGYPRSGGAFDRDDDS